MHTPDGRCLDVGSSMRVPAPATRRSPSFCTAHSVRAVIDSRAVQGGPHRRSTTDLSGRTLGEVCDERLDALVDLVADESCCFDGLTGWVVECPVEVALAGIERAFVAAAHVMRAAGPAQLVRDRWGEGRSRVSEVEHDCFTLVAALREAPDGPRHSTGVLAVVLHRRGPKQSAVPGRVSETYGTEALASTNTNGT